MVRSRPNHRARRAATHRTMRDGPHIAAHRRADRRPGARRDADRADGRPGAHGHRAGRPWPASARQTASAHLAKLLDARLLAVRAARAAPLLPPRRRRRRAAAREPDGRGVPRRRGAPASSPREPALRNARVCYDHLAGDLGVLVLRQPAAAQRVRSSARRDRAALDAGRHGLLRALRHRRRALAARAAPLCRRPASTGACAATTSAGRSARRCCSACSRWGGRGA